MTLEEQKAFFYDEGYLIVEDVVSPEELVECEEEIHKLHILAAELAANGDKRSGSFSASLMQETKSKMACPCCGRSNRRAIFPMCSKIWLHIPNSCPWFRI